MLTVFLLLPIIVAAIRWMLDHPYGIHWDEALYLNEALADIHKLYSGSLRQLGSILIGGDTWRPPAYRLIALPFLALFGFHTATARFVTLALWVASACFIFLTARRVASPAAGAVAVVVFCLSPEVISASIFFSTDGPVFLATSSMMYFLSSYWSPEAKQPRGWIGLGLAIGLGLLSKVTFVLLAFPVLVFTVFSVLRKDPRFSALLSLFKAGFLALLVAAPWWLKNFDHASRYSVFARSQPRNSLGAPSLASWVKWFYTVLVSLIGPSLAILIALVVLAWLGKVFIKKEAVLTPIQRMTLLACACVGLPLVLAQLSGTNHLLRYLCPAVIPLAIAVAVLSEAAGWIRSRVAMAAAGTLAVVQVLMIVFPVVFRNNQPVDPGFYNGGLPWRIMIRFDQWDWKPLREISQNCGLQKPRIAYLGLGRPLGSPQILYPWFAADEAPAEREGFSDPLSLWRYEQGPLDWQQVMALARQTDIVLTAPNYVGQISDREDLDNRYNSEFATRLAGDALFRGPIRLQMGRFEPVEVLVFVKQTLSCPAVTVGQVTEQIDSKTAKLGL